MSMDDNAFKRVNWNSDGRQLSDDDDEHGMPLQPPSGPGLSDADLELLTLAARAIGAVQVEVVEGEQWVNLHFADGRINYGWNPLRHSDDTFELQVLLHMVVEVEPESSYVWFDRLKLHTHESHVNQRPVEATRRAVTRAAAEIGKAMPPIPA